LRDGTAISLLSLAALVALMVWPARRLVLRQPVRQRVRRAEHPEQGVDPPTSSWGT
jgi:heme exporter protein D